MFECVLEQGELFKKIISAISDLVSDGNFQIDTNHISFQGMDSSHVSLVAMSLKQDGFKNYRCDRDLTLGINFASLSKVLKCMGTSDQLSIKCQDNGDSIFFGFENASNKRVSNFELKLMDIDSEQLGIPNTDYGINCEIPSKIFQKIITDLIQIGDSVTISVSKQGIKFSVSGDIGSGETQLTGNVKKVKKKKVDEDGDEAVKKENETPGDEEGDEDDDMKDKTKENNGDTMDEDDEEYEESKNEDAVDADDEESVIIRMTEPVSQTFALRYLQNFTKASSLSKKVLLQMGEDVPLMVSYKIDDLGEIGYYLAPKIDDDE